MKLKRTKLHGDAAWLWVAPNGTEFYLQRCYGSSKWVWYRSERDPISSEMHGGYTLSTSAVIAFYARR